MTHSRRIELLLLILIAGLPTGSSKSFAYDAPTFRCYFAQDSSEIANRCHVIMREAVSFINQRLSIAAKSFDDGRGGRILALEIDSFADDSGDDVTQFDISYARAIAIKIELQTDGLEDVPVYLRLLGDALPEVKPLNMRPDNRYVQLKMITQ